MSIQWSPFTPPVLIDIDGKVHTPPVEEAPFISWSRRCQYHSPFPEVPSSTILIIPIAAHLLDKECGKWSLIGWRVMVRSGDGTAHLWGDFAELDNAQKFCEQRVKGELEAAA